MSTEPPGRPRAGKYCPRCHAMMPRDQAVCGQCGHRFRTGTAGPALEVSPAPSESAAPDPMNRTMQFTLPPLAPRTEPPAGLRPVKTPPAETARKIASPSRRTLFVAALIACLGAVLLWPALHRTANDGSPVGVWETTLHGRASGNAHLEFTFDSGGTGQLAWRESAPAALSGQTPLQWRQNTADHLALHLDRPADGNPISQTLAGIFSHTWPLRVDPDRRRLTLGTLVFTEKP